MVISIMEGEVKVLKHSIVVVFLVELFLSWCGYVIGFGVLNDRISTTELNDE